MRINFSIPSKSIFPACAHSKRYFTGRIIGVTETKESVRNLHLIVRWKSDKSAEQSLSDLCGDSAPFDKAEYGMCCREPDKRGGNFYHFHFALHFKDKITVAKRMETLRERADIYEAFCVAHTGYHSIFNYLTKPTARKPNAKLDPVPFYSKDHPRDAALIKMLKASEEGAKRRHAGVLLQQAAARQEAAAARAPPAQVPLGSAEPPPGFFGLEPEDFLEPPEGTDGKGAKWRAGHVSKFLLQNRHLRSFKDVQRAAKKNEKLNNWLDCTSNADKKVSAILSKLAVWDQHESAKLAWKAARESDCVCEAKCKENEKPLTKWSKHLKELKELHRGTKTKVPSALKAFLVVLCSALRERDYRTPS